MRTNIFYTTCNIGGHVWNMIIDSGSCENVVFQKVVNKLSLKVENHPHHYTLSWFKKGNEIKVNKRCLIAFSIWKKYFDEVWCDVVPMDACYILIGWPRQYDSWTCMMTSIIPTPFLRKRSTSHFCPWGQKSPQSHLRTLCLLLRGYWKRVGNQGSFFGVGSVATCSWNRGNTTVRTLLEQYFDVFPQELPSKLFPMQDIQHCIDLVPGLVLANQPTYRMHSKEREEFQKQVEQLLGKWYIRPSLRLCGVLALFTPHKDGS